MGAQWRQYENWSSPPWRKQKETYKQAYIVCQSCGWWDTENDIDKRGGQCKKCNVTLRASYLEVAKGKHKWGTQKQWSWKEDSMEDKIKKIKQILPELPLAVRPAVEAVEEAIKNDAKPKEKRALAEEGYSKAASSVRKAEAAIEKAEKYAGRAKKWLDDAVEDLGEKQKGLELAKEELEKAARALLPQEEGPKHTTLHLADLLKPDGEKLIHIDLGDLADLTGGEFSEQERKEKADFLRNQEQSLAKLVRQTFQGMDEKIKEIRRERAAKSENFRQAAKKRKTDDAPVEAPDLHGDDDLDLGADERGEPGAGEKATRGAGAGKASSSAGPELPEKGKPGKASQESDLASEVGEDDQELRKEVREMARKKREEKAAAVGEAKKCG